MQEDRDDRLLLITLADHAGSAVEGEEFVIDLLFFHVEQVRYVAVELKVAKFRAEHAAQLELCVSLQ